jgi:uncharacterized protein
MTEKAMAVPISQIGSGINVTFGVPATKIANEEKSMELVTIESDWLLPFLEEVELMGSDQKEVQFQVLLSYESNLIRARGHLNFAPKLECVRCLTRFRMSLSTKLGGFFMENGQEPKSRSDVHIHATQGQVEEIELGEDDLDVYYFKQRTIKLDELILDAMQLSLPDLPLCHEECKGLCIECGFSLNEMTSCPKTGGKGQDSCPNPGLLPH